MLANEIFNNDNWIGTIVWKNVTDNNPTNIAIEHEYIICYAKNKLIKIEYEDKLPSVIQLDGRLGAYELKEIFIESKKVFDNPKPVQLLKQIFSYVLDKNDIILDSFSGSGTTAHAVLDLNKEDGGNRKFILVESKRKINPILK